MKVALSLALLLALSQAETAYDPAPRKKEYPWMSLARWTQMHESFLKRAKEGKIDLLFLGDSITEGWGNNAVWQKYYGPLHAANFGIGGDTTENVLWRIQNGEIEGLSPKVVVLMIGTNNFGLQGHQPDDVAKGVTTIVQTLRKKLPTSKILLLAIFPRDEKPGTENRNRIKKVNDQIVALDDKKNVRFLDIGAKLANPDGTLSKEIMPDFLHLSEKGYQIWADAMDPLLKQLLGN
ncbi:MAG TPA: platelet-activating factor acetylhydrolase IB subunit [Planctomycetota bacterium]|nr:platelet-activating factor acetylhydrolase IB subunit [Planctomycetota bacterium]